MKRYMRMRMASRPQVYDQLQDQREDTFSKIKTQLQLVNDLNEVLDQTGDSNIEFQYNAAITDLKKSMEELQQAGMSMSDLYSRFGKDILKAQVLKSRADISEIEAKQGEQHLVDTVNEDALIARMNLNEQVDGRVQLINELQRQGYNVTGMRSEDVQRLNQRIAGLASASQQQQNLRRGFQATGQRFRGDGGPGAPGAPPGAPGGRPGLMPAQADAAQVAIPLHGQAIPLRQAPPDIRPLQFQIQRQASFAQAADRARDMHGQARQRLFSDELIQDVPRNMQIAENRQMQTVRAAIINQPIPRSQKVRRLREWEEAGFFRNVLEWYDQNQQEFDDEQQQQVRQQQQRDFSDASYGSRVMSSASQASSTGAQHNMLPVPQSVRPGQMEQRQVQIAQIQQDIGRDLFQSMIQATQQQIGESRRQYMRRLEEDAQQQAETREQALQQQPEESKEERKHEFEESSLIGPARDPDEALAFNVAIGQIREQQRQRTYSSEESPVEGGGMPRGPLEPTNSELAVTVPKTNTSWSSQLSQETLMSASTAASSLASAASKGIEFVKPVAYPRTLEQGISRSDIQHHAAQIKNQVDINLQKMQRHIINMNKLQNLNAAETRYRNELESDLKTNMKEIMGQFVGKAYTVKDIASRTGVNARGLNKPRLVHELTIQQLNSLYQEAYYNVTGLETTVQIAA